jgi:hypothetical protein
MKSLTSNAISSFFSDMDTGDNDDVFIGGRVEIEELLFALLQHESSSSDAGEIYPDSS